ncbi:hypothetical protein GCM10029964_116790 [Kibdelosporangium lantanae]
MAWRIAARVAGSSGAAPEVSSRSVERASPSCSAGTWANAWYIGGTPTIAVIRKSLHAFNAGSTLKWSIRTPVAAAAATWKTPGPRPYAWNSGTARSTRSVAVTGAGFNAAHCSTFANSARWESITPRGTPDVPDV